METKESISIHTGLALTQTASGNGKFQLATDPETVQIVQGWVLPNASTHAKGHHQEFVSLHDVFAKAKHRLSLLLVVGIDGNGETLPLAWALEYNENYIWILVSICVRGWTMNEPAKGVAAKRA